MKTFRLCCFKKFLYTVSLVLLFSATPTWSSQTLQVQDQSFRYLSELIGRFEPFLKGDFFLQEPMIFFNKTLSLLASGALLYTLLMSFLSTAHEGKLLGKNWGSLWGAVRSGIGVLLILPENQGFSKIQAFVLWIILQGISAANMLSETVFNFIETSPIASSQVLYPELRLETDKDLRSLYRAALLTNLINISQQEIASIEEDILEEQKIDPVSILSFSLSNEDVQTYLYSMPKYQYAYLINPHSSIEPYNICGGLQINLYTEIEGVLSKGQANFLNQKANTEALFLLLSVSDLAKFVITQTQANTFENLDPEDLSVWIAPVVAQWKKLTSEIVLPAAETQKYEQEGKKHGWMHLSSYYTSLSNRIRKNTLMSHIPIILTPASENLLKKEVKKEYENLEQMVDSICNSSWMRLAQAYSHNIDPNPPGMLINPHSGQPSFGESTYGLSKFISKHVLPYYTGKKGIDTEQDPLVKIASNGAILFTLLDYIWISILGLSSIHLITSVFSCQNPMAIVSSVSLSFIRTVVMFPTILLYAAAVTMAIYIPLIPFLTYFGATIGWLFSTIEAIIGAPLIALALAIPSPDEFGKAAKSLLLLFHVFLKPSLIVISFISAIQLTKIALHMLHFSFSSTLKVQSVDSLFLFVAFISLYAGIALAIIQRIFSLTYLMPDKIFRWLGSALEGADAAHLIEGSKDKFEQGSRPVKEIILSRLSYPFSKKNDSE